MKIANEKLSLIEIKKARNEKATYISQSLVNKSESAIM